MPPRRWVVPVAFRSEPETSKPSERRISARPLMPTPPTPTKWMCRTRPRNTSAPPRWGLLTREAQEIFGDGASGVGCARGARGVGHSFPHRRVAREPDERAGEQLGARVALLDRDCRSGVLERLC